MAKGKLTGTCKWWSPAKGFGFISPSSGGKDFFCHWTGINGNSGARRDLEDGVPVTFDAIETDKGPAAVNVDLA